MTDLAQHLVEAKVVSVKPGDVIWLRTENRISRDIAAELKKQAEQIWPNHQIVVGVDIDVAIVREDSPHGNPKVRKAAAPPPTRAAATGHKEQI